MRSLAVLVPVLGRPHRVKPLLDSVRAATPHARVYFVPDPTDHDEIAEIEANDGVIIAKMPGTYAVKINVAAARTDEDLILLGADDIHCHPGWFEIATAHLSDQIQVVGLNDLCNRRTMRGEHSTHTLLTREYAQLGTIDEPGKIFHEGYLHDWCDDEFVQTAKARGAFSHASDAIVEHLHPNAGKAADDRTYRIGRGRARRGRRIFESRRHLWQGV